MSSFPSNVKIDLVASTKSFEIIFQRVKEYVDAMVEVMKTWWPVVSGAQRAEAQRVHRMYRRRQLARRRRNRRR